MTHAITTPFWERALILILGPPIMACLWWAMSNGWARTAQAGTISERTQRRNKVGFWVLLTLMYVMSAGLSLYAWLR
ncbi:MAG: hypothetical protein WCF30_07920 [Terracidiphilus sp.]